jgi:hypothetical protein
MLFSLGSVRRPSRASGSARAIPLRALILLAVVGLGAGCGSSGVAFTSGSEGGVAGSAGAGQAGSAADGGSSDAGVEAKDDAAATTGAAGTQVADVVPGGTITAPGAYLTMTSATGAGPCAGVTLGDVLAQIRADDSALADIQTIYNPATTTGDGTFIYPYARADGGFDVVFKRGLGDCPAGCTENDYVYFATDAACNAVSVGRFESAWGTSTCLTASGTPLWNHPPAPDPLTVCGQDNTAQALGGTYHLQARGSHTPCSTTPTAAITVATTITVLIEQDAKDPSTGHVTFSGTGDTLVDGTRLAATFQRRRFDAQMQSSDPSSSCPRQSSISARYDFERYEPGTIEANQMGGDDCSSCKGSTSLALSP